MNKQRLRKWFCLSVGYLSLITGVIGVVVPILPTTPLIILAAACFLRSSSRMHHWITHHPWFGKIISDYTEYHVVSRKTKIFALVVLWGSISYSTLVAIDIAWVRWLLLAIGVGVTIHLVLLREAPMMKTKTCGESDMLSQEEA